ncbi:MAG: molybdopterin-dependent oxidoreductase [Anaerolineales bacterium]|nr:molybdopterin-dependent oxidoreductase [Anaerolineales bacterium]
MVISLFLTLLALVVVISGFAWSWRFGPDLVWIGGFGDAVIGWHWMLGLGLWAPLLVHVARRWPRPRSTDFTGRRSALKLAALTGAGLAGWQFAEALARLRADPDQPRAVTGSRCLAPFAGNAMPVTLSLGERELHIDPAMWRLQIVIDGMATEVTYARLLALPATELEATLDCTSGWYSPQRWRGVLLSDLLAAVSAHPGPTAVRLIGQSGYNTLLAGDSARDLLLATHLGNEPLATWHGFPVRAVAPACRGWQWVKWLARVEIIG